MGKSRYKLLGEVTLGDLTVEGEFIDNKTNETYGTLRQAVGLLNQYDLENKVLSDLNQNYCFGSLGYIKTLAWNFDDILYIKKDTENGNMSLDVYVKADYDWCELSRFTKNLPCGTKCKFIVVKDVFFKETFEII